MKLQFKPSLVRACLAASGAMLIAGCRSSSPPSPPNGGQRLTQKPTRKTSHRSNPSNAGNTGAYNMNAPRLPNPKLTPGDTLDVTSQDFCVSGYTKNVRNVPASVKAQVYKEYGITHREKGEYEVDHLISLELGGSNSVKNLWPQSYKTQPLNAHIKDTLENKLHALICSGQVDAKVAQQDIARDWVAAYKKYVGPLPSGSDDAAPIDLREVDNTSSNSSPAASVNTISDNSGSNARPGAANGQVWVNLNSGKYWGPGTRYYGKTKKGQYMSESDAINAGYAAAQAN